MTEKLIKCPVCNYHLGVITLAEYHQPGNAVCLHLKFNEWCRVNEYTDVRTYGRITSAAGLLKRVPYVHFEEDPAKDPEGDYVRNMKVPMLSFRAVAPIWAVKLLDQLDHNVPLIKRIGHYKETANKSKRWTRNQVWYTGDRVGTVRPVIDLAMRVRLLKVCAHNAMTKEFAADDLEALAVMAASV